MSRPVSPFIVFCHAKRNEIKAANPNAKFGDIAKLLTAEWKKLNASQEQTYVRQNVTVSLTPEPSSDAGLRRSSRLRNKLRGVDFFGRKL